MEGFILRIGVISSGLVVSGVSIFVIGRVESIILPELILMIFVSR